MPQLHETMKPPEVEHTDPDTFFAAMEDWVQAEALLATFEPETTDYKEQEKYVEDVKTVFKGQLEALFRRMAL